jgi:hypothetical protein
MKNNIKEIDQHHPHCNFHRTLLTEGRPSHGINGREKQEEQGRRAKNKTKYI